MEVEDDLQPAQVPGRLTVAGRVTNVHEASGDFNVTVMQRVQNGPIDSEIFVHANMDLSALPYPPSTRMPSEGALVSFTGILKGAGAGVARLTVDDICYLPLRIRHVITAVPMLL